MKEKGKLVKKEGKMGRVRCEVTPGGFVDAGTEKAVSGYEKAFSGDEKG